MPMIAPRPSRRPNKDAPFADVVVVDDVAVLDFASPVAGWLLLGFLSAMVFSLRLSAEAFASGRDSRMRMNPMCSL